MWGQEVDISAMSKIRNPRIDCEVISDYIRYLILVYTEYKRTTYIS